MKQLSTLTIVVIKCLRGTDRQPIAIETRNDFCVISNESFSTKRNETRYSRQKETELLLCCKNDISRRKQTKKNIYFTTKRNETRCTFLFYRYYSVDGIHRYFQLTMKHDLINNFHLVLEPRRIFRSTSNKNWSRSLGI